MSSTLNANYESAEMRELEGKKGNHEENNILDKAYTCERVEHGTLEEIREIQCDKRR